VNSRFLDVDGSINLRDFGGYRTSGGRTVKWGLLFRCGALSELSAKGLGQFETLGVSTICDLRRDAEVSMNPAPEHLVSANRHHIPINPGSMTQMRESLGNPLHQAEDRLRLMEQSTRELARDHHDEYALLFRHLLETDGGFLLHCSAGKDRTGFGAALILMALGVDESIVMQDYLLTNQAATLRTYMTTRMRSRQSIDPESLDILMSVRAEYLLAAFEQLHQQHGSPVNYLDAIGVDSKVRRELCARLLMSEQAIQQ
jgi:protein-tyrosine phosphatase